MMLGDSKRFARTSRSAAAFLLGSTILACQVEKPAASSVPETPAACEARHRRFVQFLGSLPDRSVASAVHVDLPVSTLGRAPGVGPVLEISESTLVLDGDVSPATTPAERGAHLKRWVDGLHAPRSGEKSALYVAAAADLEIGALRSHLAAIPEGVEVKLLVHAKSAAPGAERAKSEALASARELLAERDPAKRAALSSRAYDAFSNCSAFDGAVKATAATWPVRRAALIEAASKCRCTELDTDSLQQIASAEQRAGSSELGYLPASFLRDERCGASMPKRSVGKLVKQIEAFDEEFAGSFEDDAMRFEEVLKDERLLEYFCNALPGETLAAEQRARATLYWRFPGTGACQGWRFEPLAPGAPMGTWRRVAPAGVPPLAFHYWQAAEEIRLFGPVPEGSTSKPTDESEWNCKENYRLVGVDGRSIQTETGRWFMDEAACRAAPEPPSTSGCVSALAAAPQG